MFALPPQLVEGFKNSPLMDLLGYPSWVAPKMEKQMKELF